MPARFRIKKLKTEPVPARPWCIADREHPHWIGRAATHVEALSVAADRVAADEVTLTGVPFGDILDAFAAPFRALGRAVVDLFDEDDDPDDYALVPPALPTTVHLRPRVRHVNAPCSVVPIVPGILDIGMRVAREVDDALATLSDSEKADTIELARSTMLSIAEAAAVVKARRHA